MRNFQIGRVMGIPIRINITLLVFLPLLAWLLSRPAQIAAYVGVIDAIAPYPIDPDVITAGDTPVVIGVVSAIGLFGGVLLHELGHSYVARREGIEISSITLWIFGGMAHMADLPEDWNVEFWIAIAGPVTSVALGGILAGVLLIVPPGAPVVAFVIGWLAVINVVLALFNMIPAFPMDGGRILRALLARSRPYADATQTAASVGKFFGIVMAIVGIVAFAPLLILIAMFVYIAAGAESRTTVVRSLLRDITVADLMTDSVTTVDMDASIQELFDRMLRERHTGYPVVDSEGRLVGVVTLARIRSIPANRRGSTNVGEVMLREQPTVAPDDDAFEALQILGSSGSDRVIVTDGGRIVGIVSQSDMVTMLEVLQGFGPDDRQELTPDGYA